MKTLRLLVLLLSITLVGFGTAAIAQGLEIIPCPGAPIVMGSSCNPTYGYFDTENLTGSASHKYSFVATSKKFKLDFKSIPLGPLDMQTLVKAYFLGDVCSSAEANCSNCNELVVGNTYYINIVMYQGGYNQANRATYSLCVSQDTTSTQPVIPPVNDSCSKAIAIVAGDKCSPVAGTTEHATQSMPPENCNNYTTSSIANDVWYSFVAPAASVYVDVQPLYDGQPLLVLIDNCGGNLVACAERADGYNVRIHTNNLIPGATYYARVYDKNDAAFNKSFTICAYKDTVAPPINDECTNAISLVANTSCNSIKGDLKGATHSAPDTACGITYTNESDVWYKFTATSINEIIDVTGNQSFHPKLVLMDQCNGQVIACSYNYGNSSRLRANKLSLGATYFIKVIGPINARDTLPFSICVYYPLAPINDECANATNLTVGTSCNPITGDVTGATESMPIRKCKDNEYPTTNTGNDVWFKFTANSADENITLSTTVGYAMFLLDGCNGTVIGCNDGEPPHNLFDPEIKMFATGLTVNATYYIRIFKYEELDYGNTFNLCVFTPPTPPNDACANAIELNSSLVQGTITGATQSLPPNSCAGRTSTKANDVWYKFTAVSSEMQIGIQTDCGDLDLDAFILNSCNGAMLFCGATDYSTCPSLAHTSCDITASGLSIGSTYYLRLYAYNDAAIYTRDFQAYTISATSIGQSGIDNANKENLIIYPNPSNGLIYIESPNILHNSPILIYNTLGELVRTQFASEKKATMDLSALNSGMYTVRIPTQSGVINKRVFLNK